MSKTKPLLASSVAAARRVYAECDLRHPRDLHMDAIAARYGAMVLYGPMRTASGALVRSSRWAIIWVDEETEGTPRGDFTKAHEVGHLLMHSIEDHFRQCVNDEAPGASRSREARAADKLVRRVEREANHFSTELLMPEAWAAPLCTAPKPALEDVERLSRAFSTSFHASAIRFVELATAPCALVHSVGGLIKRSTETESFPGRIVQRRPLHPRSVAARMQGRRAGGEGAPREVPGAAWGDDGGPGFLEHAIAWGPDVLSWVVALG
jgi:hypothetical protein